jgi:hypothetical protein
MATKTKKLIANTTFQEIGAGPLFLTINPERGFFEMYINLANTAPTANTTDIFLVKPVAGENYLDVELATGDKIWMRTLRGDHPISWVQR